ncbi:hypothetical protein EIZ62_00215 [Streptomyces ficellus]|uniref:Tetratricopeptide repeat protein n=1 Tax=Streptomyces ficellus TaxID=1977088 RepID=A0A6I6FRY8_9ACTN|nr:hypothetical protein EIZ62_00215 [Streptomyces ficellus]
MRLASGKPLEPIAGDDTGGTYFLCGGTAVLHASSEGDAVLIADSVGEALEMLVRLPEWCEGLTSELDEDGMIAAVRAGDDEAREEFAPELDAQREALLSGLGLPRRPLVELFAMAESAAGRTDPHQVLLNARELCAYRLHESYRVPLRDVVLGPGREALERLRAGDSGVRKAVADDAVLRAGILWAAYEDWRDEGRRADGRREEDVPLLRFLLERENTVGSERFEERWLAAVLLASYGHDEDAPLLRSATSGAVGSGAVGAWAAGPEAERFGREAESPFTWIDLAFRQGRVEHARAALIRLLDDTGPDAERLRRLSRALERVGDWAQAARAQANLLSLQDSAWDRASEAYALARLERVKGDLAAAGRALHKARTALGLEGGAPDDSVAEWHRRGLGRLVTEQHLELVAAALEAGDGDLARTTMVHARRLLGTVGAESAKALSRLSTRAKWAVAGLPRSGA